VVPSRVAKASSPVQVAPTRLVRAPWVSVAESAKRGASPWRSETSNGPCSRAETASPRAGVAATCRSTTPERNSALLATVVRSSALASD
jgi:hypothetical protein